MAGIFSSNTSIMTTANGKLVTHINRVLNSRTLQGTLSSPLCVGWMAVQYEVGLTANEEID